MDLYSYLRMTVKFTSDCFFNVDISTLSLTILLRNKIFLYETFARCNYNALTCSKPICKTNVVSVNLTASYRVASFLADDAIKFIAKRFKIYYKLIRNKLTDHQLELNLRKPAARLQ